VERQLDFSEAGKAVTKFLASQNRRIFSMSTENALLTLLREGVSVQEASIDSKRDLEDALRSSCNDFIDHSSMKLAAPLLHFIDSYKSIVAVASSLNNKSIPISVGTKDHDFMNTASVSTMIQNSKESFQENIVSLKEKICTYLESTAAQSILFKPVIRKIIRAIDDLKCFVSDVEDSDYSGWNELTREEVRSGLQELESLVRELKIGVVQLS
jgi:cobalamin biosynthesis Co2+ chelatase CbiK